MVTDSYCFVVDGDSVPADSITSSPQYWRPTSATTRFYCSEDKRMQTFKKVHCVFCHGDLKAAFGNRNKRAGMEKVPLKFIFRVSRYFSYWYSSRFFHRIVSVVSPVTEEGHQIFGFNNRIFVQYLWRTDRKSDRKKVAEEYKESLTVRESNKKPSYSVANRRFSTIIRRLSAEMLDTSPSFVH